MSELIFIYKISDDDILIYFQTEISFYVYLRTEKENKWKFNKYTSGVSITKETRSLIS